MGQDPRTAGQDPIEGQDPWHVCSHRPLAWALDRVENPRRAMARLTGGQFYNTDVTIDGIGEGGGSCGRDASRELIRATAQDTALAVGSLAAFHSSVDGSRFQVPRDDAADDDDDDALLCRWRAGGWKA